MKRDYIDFQSRDQPIGYLLTFRSYGTWLHGDERGSIDRNHNAYGTPALPGSIQRERRNRLLLNQPPVYLNVRQRMVVQSSIKDTCNMRRWTLWESHVRTNHVHVVLSCDKKPSAALSALKANATRSMRSAGCWQSEFTPWAHGGSKKYLWSEKHLGEAIAYVKYGRACRWIIEMALIRSLPLPVLTRRFPCESPTRATASSGCLIHFNRHRTR